MTRNLAVVMSTWKQPSTWFTTWPFFRTTSPCVWTLAATMTLGLDSLGTWRAWSWIRIDNESLYRVFGYLNGDVDRCTYLGDTAINIHVRMLVLEVYCRSVHRNEVQSMGQTWDLAGSGKCKKKITINNRIILERRKNEKMLWEQTSFSQKQ